MNIFILDLFNDNIGGLNDLDSFKELSEYRRIHFNSDIVYLINNYLDDFKHHKEKELRNLINHYQIDYTKPSILNGVIHEKDYLDYYNNMDKIINNLVKVFEI